MRSGQRRIAIVEDHSLQRARTAELISGVEGYNLVFVGATSHEFVQWLRDVSKQRRPHLLILDLMVDQGDSVSLELVRGLINAGLRIVVVSALTSHTLVQGVLQAGVTAIVSKRDSEEDILSATRAVLRGEGWMTTDLAAAMASDSNRPKLSIQEEKALLMYASGLTLQRVGEEMNVSRETAKEYLGRVRKKYAAQGQAVKSQLDFGRVAWRDGYIDP